MRQLTGAMLPGPDGSSNGRIATAAHVVQTANRPPRQQRVLRRATRRGNHEPACRVTTAITAAPSGAAGAMRASTRTCSRAKPSSSARAATSATPCNDGIAPEVPGHTEATHAEAEKGPQQVTDPPVTVQQIVDAAAPGGGAEARMSGHRRSRSGVPVEVERIGERESGKVPQRLAAQLRLFPVDDTGHRAVAHQHVAAPEIAVHGGTRCAVTPQRRARALHTGEHFTANRVRRETARGDAAPSHRPSRRTPRRPRSPDETG